LVAVADNERQAALVGEVGERLTLVICDEEALGSVGPREFEGMRNRREVHRFALFQDGLGGSAGDGDAQHATALGV
jgi:hypothetical protein